MPAAIDSSGWGRKSTGSGVRPEFKSCLYSLAIVHSWTSHVTSPSLVLSFVKREEGTGIQREDNELMHPRHVSQCLCLACRAASGPPQRAVTSHFPFERCDQGPGRRLHLSPPCSPYKEPQGHLIYFYISFPSLVPPFLSFLIPLPLFQK